MSVAKPWLDWRSEKSRLATVFASPGGVVRVEATPSGPLVEFANVLRGHLSAGNWDRPWRTIQFDPENSETRYFGEMTRQIERNLDIQPKAVGTCSFGGDTQIASELSASTISITNSFNFGGDSYDRSVVDETRSKQIIDNIKARIASESFCFLFLNSENFPRHDLQSFLSLLWNGGLSSLAGQGVLLLDFSRSRRRTDVDWPPATDLDLKLADDFDETSRDHAVKDLAAFLLSERREATQPEAEAYSRAMLDSHHGPATLYAQLAAIFAAKARST